MLNILLVEDNILFRKTLSGLLRSRFPSIAVNEASDAQDALDKVSKLQPDIIFMDIHLLGETGLEITRKIRKLYDDIVIIVLTNHDLPEYRERAIRNGANGFLSKASTGCMEDILSCVERTLTAKVDS